MTRWRHLPITVQENPGVLALEDRYRFRAWCRLTPHIKLEVSASTGKLARTKLKAQLDELAEALRCHQ